MIELKKPRILGWNDKGDISEIKRYLSSLVDELQFALNTIENEKGDMKAEIEALKAEIVSLKAQIEELKEA